jgi:molybdenum cofactor cytidylyltransferase
VSESAIGIIVLAAGASSRMGTPKQLLKYEGETLLRRAVRAALETPCRPVIVVLGSDAPALREEIATTGARIVFNEAWAEGMSSSLGCGLRALETSSAASSQIEAAIVMLCDQPFVQSNVINSLVETYRARRAPPLVASEYEAGGEKSLGVPALFSRALFPELAQLRGAEGAQRIIKRHRAAAALIAVPEAAFDVDTPDDYRALQEKAKRDAGSG